MSEEKKDELIPGYKPLTDFVVSKNEYKNCVNLNKEKGSQWIIYKRQYPEDSGKYIAYKKPAETPESCDLFYKILIRELEITNKVRHPCTIELISFDLSDRKKPNVVVRYYEKGSLKKLFEETNYLSNNIDNTTRFIIMYGIARGVKYLHKLKIFHRDLKPENIVIGKDYHPHIADFGYSKSTKDGQAQSDIYGTEAYFAPEMLDGLDYSFPADIFALGLIFYQITEKKFYLVDEKMCYLKDFRRKIELGQKPKMNHDNNFRDMIYQMIDKDPEKRPKIEEICTILEDEKNWFEDVDKEKFLEYKKMIDDYEQEQIPILNKAKVFIQDDASSLTQQIKKKEISTKYQKIQTLLKNCMKLNSEAEFALGCIFYTGYEGIPKDYVDAYYYFNESYLHGNQQAKVLMNNIYQEILENEYGNNNTIILYDDDKNKDKNKDKEKEIYNNLKNKKSQLIYGMIKESLNEQEEALSFYMKSAKQGCKEAKGRLGSLLRKMNYFGEEAEKLLKESIKEEENYQIDSNERKLSKLNLGLLKLYRAKNMLKPRKEKEKKKEQTKAKAKETQATSGEEEECEKQEHDKDEEDPIQKAEDKKIAESLNEAIDIFTELLNEDHPDAALLIGTCYQLKKDQENAKAYYEISSKQYSNESAERILKYYDNIK